MTEKPSPERKAEPVHRGRYEPELERRAREFREGSGKIPGPFFGRLPDGTPYLDDSLPFVRRQRSGAGFVTVVDTTEATRRGHNFYRERPGVIVYES